MSKKNNRVRIYQAICIVILSICILLPVVTPFLQPGLIDTFDGILHQYRIAAFHTLIKDGVIPPRWSSSLSYGWGTPVFNYNWSFPYWLAEPFLFANMSLTGAHNAVIVCSIIFTFISTFVFIYIWLGIWSAVLSSTVMVWGLYFLYTVFTTGAIGTLTGVIFWPLLLLSVVLTSQNRMRLGFILGSLSFFGVMISHQTLFLMIVPIVLIFSFILQRRSDAIQTTKMTFLSLCMGLLLSAYFWLPAISEKSFIHIKDTEIQYQGNFLTIQSLFLQPKFYETTSIMWWNRVYGSTLYGVGWSILCIVILSCIYFIRKKNNRVPIFFILVFVISLFLMTPYSLKFWQYIPLLSSFIYPARFHMLALFSASVLSALLVENSKNKPFIAISIMCLTIFLNVYAIPSRFQRVYWNDDHYFKGGSTSDVWGEFLPLSASQSHLSGKEAWVENPPVRVSRGDAKISLVSKKSTTISAHVSVPKEADIIINQHYFPGWVIFDNGSLIPLSIYPSGEMQVTLLPGEHVVRAIFTDTPIRRISNRISMVSFIIFVLLIVNFHRIKNNKERVRSPARHPCDQTLAGG